MNNQYLTIDGLYKYEIEDILEGGMGYVFLLSKTQRSYSPSRMDKILDRSTKLKDHLKYPYRKKLAAKTVKEEIAMPLFLRECNVWLNIEEPGVVSLLKVVKIKETIFALMPRYAGNLRSLVSVHSLPKIEIFKSLYNPIFSLHTVYKKYGIVHQDIKPDNLLYDFDEGRLSILISDWGIANVQANSIPHSQKDLAPKLLKTIRGFGTIPYMAPERYTCYISDIRADIFSLGIIFYEILTGKNRMTIIVQFQNKY